MARTIDGEAFKSMLLAAAGAIETHKEELNDLNVFPVPDGDTGTNMSLTLNAAAAELMKLPSPLTLGKALEVTSASLLRGARGNSGVIVSLLFRGIGKHLKDYSEAGPLDFANALCEGVTTAYKAVMKPSEGTILTVSRVSSDMAVKAAEVEDADVEAMLLAALEEAKRALPETTEQNPVLKKAGVIDAGAYGWLLILDAMYQAACGKPGLLDLFKPKKADAIDLGSVDFSAYDTGDITFGYCTEFLAERKDQRRSPDKLRAFLESIGDCVVVVDDDELIKVHVHTDHPDRALTEGLRFGPLSAVKIENMHEQHGRLVDEEVAENIKKRTIAPIEKRFGFVAVANGTGVCDIFGDLGVDKIVNGGQTMNPSTEDILMAIDATPAEVVFVLPNNKNIIMAGEQAAELSERVVIVLPTRTVPQGLAAMLAFEPDAEPDANKQTMLASVDNVRSGQITYAARDSVFEGKKIKAGDYMGFSDSKMVATGAKFEEVVRKLAGSMCDKKSAFITILSGQDATAEQIMLVQEAFEKQAKNAEVNVIPGGQVVYSFIVSVE